MRVQATSVGPFAQLLAWDAPFLPRVIEFSVTGDDVALRFDETGAGVGTVCRWPRGQRVAVALQMVATAAFLFERGWYPSRSLLRGARVTRGEGGPSLRLATLPRMHAGDPHLEGHLRLALSTGDNVVVAAVGPVVRALLPERASDLRRAETSRLAWETPEAWVELLLGEARRAAVRHEEGSGRALWARHFSLPPVGLFWVEEADLLARLVIAARLAALGRSVHVASGAFEEADVDRLQARAAATGLDCLIFTTLSLPGVAPLPLAGGADGTWVLAPQRALAVEHAAAACRAAETRPSTARSVLESGAASGFARPPHAGATREREALLSPEARRTLRWLEGAPVGLAEDELRALAGPTCETVEELARLGLARRRRGVWVSRRDAGPLEPARLAAMAEALPESSAAGVVARALACGRWQPAHAWCEVRLAAGAPGDALEVARAAATCGPLRLLAAEAALTLGRLAEAQALLEGVAESKRDSCWHALAAWWAEQTGVPERAADECAAATGDLPARLAARVELVAGELARRQGEHEAELRHLERAVAAVSPALADAELARAARSGREALRHLRRARAAGWGGDEKARFLQLVALAALDRGSPAGAATALRASLRAASGENLRLLGEIHADLGCASIQADRPVVADRHLLLAERLLERCGSRRAVTLVRANRAVLACDRMDWRTCRELTLAARDMRGELDDEPTWLGELELARAELARGDVAAVRALLPTLEEGVGRHGTHLGLVQALGDLKAHLALALGDLLGAVRAAETAEPGERELVLALERAGEGVDPPTGLPHRWGVVVTALLLAAWRRGDEAGARARMRRALERMPREASVGLARFVVLLARQGEHLPVGWTEIERAAEVTLEQAQLDGWAGNLRVACGHDPVRVVRALDGIVNAGTDCLAPVRLEALARALGLRSLRIERAGVTLASWGVPEGDTAELAADGIRVLAAGTLPTIAEAALSLVARHVATLSVVGTSAVARSGGELLGGSAALAAVREQIARWGPLPINVLVAGEPGTGKELAARALHRESRRSGSFVAVNCAGLPGSLLESELFGVVRGAYTGADRDRAGLVEAAEGGTLFLDEVGELPVELQGKLLRLLQGREVRRVGDTRSRTVDVRFIAATNRDLQAAAAAGTFRRDLYYRLAVAVIEMPPLRERPEDVDTLARHFASHIAQTLRRPGVGLAPAALELLRRGSWPGNVRELETVIIRAVAAARPGEVLGPDRFPGVVPAAPATQHLPSWPLALADFRRSYFKAVLRESGGNRTQAARRAGVSRQTLLYHLRELGIRGRDES